MSVGVAAALAAVFGAIVGSFLNVVAYRLPRKESLSHPAVRAVPSAGRRSSPTTTSRSSGWLWLRGKCRACRAPISARYPLVEALTGLLCALCVLVYGADNDVWAPLLFVLLLVPITLIDLEHHIIPNVLTAIGAVGAIALLIAFDSDSLVEHLIAGGRGGRLLPARRDRLPGRHGDGGRQARGRHGALPRARRRARDLRRADRRHADRRR